MSEPGGAGLGTVGFSPVVAARMCKEAGFVSYKMRDFKVRIGRGYNRSLTMQFGLKVRR